jgi:hypothetical protein
MHIQLHDNITLKEIKNVFSDYYPYLKLEFYSKPHLLYESSDERDIMPDEKMLKEIKEIHIDGVIDIQPTEKVTDLEFEFQRRFGLPVQVLRMEQGVWTQTTGMDTFTLKDVNQYSKNDSDEDLVDEYEEGFEELKTE